MIYICTQDLYHKKGAKSFSKDKEYDSLDAKPGALLFIDNQGLYHEVTDDQTEGAWLQYFVLPEEAVDISELLAILEEPAFA